MNKIYKTNLRDARIASGLTQEELAEKIHYSRSRVSAWENGYSQPKEEIIQELVGILNSPRQYLFEGNKNIDASQCDIHRINDRLSNLEQTVTDLVNKYNALSDLFEKQT